MTESPDRAAAHKAVALAIKEGRLPKARTQICVDCGGPASDWDHHLGYAPEHVLDVQPRCRRCHSHRHTYDRTHAPRRKPTHFHPLYLRNLNRLRNEQHLTSRALASRAGVSVLTIYRLQELRYESSLKTLRALAEALGVEPQELVGVES